VFERLCVAKSTSGNPVCVCVVSVRVLDGVGLDCGVRVRSMCVLVGFGGVSWCVQSVCVVSVSVYVSMYVCLCLCMWSRLHLWVLVCVCVRGVVVCHDGRQRGRDGHSNDRNCKD
jgi:hypothetical protein